MKKLGFIGLLIALLIIASCRKNEPGKSGSMEYNINFTTQQIVLKTDETASDTTYTQFGDYITSLTPSKFTAHIWTIGYIDTVLNFSINYANMLQYIEQNQQKLPANDATRFIDFTNNNLVSFDPVIYGSVNNDQVFEKPQIDFKYFYFIPINLYQEVQLPSQYNNVLLNMFPGAIIQNNMLKVDYRDIMKKIFPNTSVGWVTYFIFGNTDSTFVVNANGEQVDMSEDCPIAEPNKDLVIRSSNYSNMVLNSPLDGGTVVLNGTLSFNTSNLIQIYAGADNIPYTSDDVVVYAPRFWERIKSRLEIN
jgi:hypothetical protein